MLKHAMKPVRLVTRMVVDVCWACSRERSGFHVGICDALGLTVQAPTQSALRGAIPQAHAALLADLRAHGDLEQFAAHRGWVPEQRAEPTTPGSRELELTWELMEQHEQGTGGRVPARSVEIALRVLGYTTRNEVNGWVICCRKSSAHRALLPNAGDVDEAAAASMLLQCGVSPTGLIAFLQSGQLPNIFAR